MTKSFYFNIIENLMKTITLSKILVLLAALASFSGTARGQHRITEVKYPSVVGHTIVKEYTFPATVSYVETATGHYFASADASMSVLNAQIDPNIHVRDFVIFEDYVYFCGFDNSQQATVGVWGWFRIPDLVTSSMSYYVYSGFHCVQRYADTLKGIVAFRDHMNTLHVAVCGSVSDGSASNQSCMLDLTGVAGSPNWNCTMGVTPITPGYYEKITRICLTDNLVVTVGTVPMGCGIVNHRVHRRNDMFLSGGPQDSSIYFPGDVWPRPWSHAICHVQGDTVAVAVKHDKNTIVPNEGVMMYVFDASLVYVGMNAAHAIELDLGQYTNTSDIFDIRYSRPHREVTLLMSGGFLMGTGSTVYEWPTAPIPPAVTPTFLSDRRMISLDNYNTQQHFLTMGTDNSDPSKVNYFIQSLQSGAVCATKLLPLYGGLDYAVKIDKTPYTVCTSVLTCEKREPVKYLKLDQETICSD